VQLITFALICQQDQIPAAFGQSLRQMRPPDGDVQKTVMQPALFSFPPVDTPRALGYIARSAQMAELVDALVSGTSAARRGGSSPLLGTNYQ